MGDPWGRRTLVGTQPANWITPVRNWDTLMLSIGWGVWLPLAVDGFDTSGNGRHATVTRGTFTGGAFTGSPLAEVPYGAWMNNPVFTVMCAFKTAAWGAAVCGRFHDVGVTANQNWTIENDQTPWSPSMTFFVTNSGGTNSVVVGPAVSNNAWHLAVITVDPGKTFTAYTDGAANGSAAMASVNNGGASTENLYLGRRSAAQTSSEHWNGQLKQYAYAPGIALTSGDVTGLWAAFNRAGLAA